MDVIAECWAILAVLTMILYMYFSRGRANVAGAIAPLLLLPLFHLFGGPLSRLLTAGWLAGLPAGLVHIALDLLAVVTACCIFGALAHGMTNKRLRNLYLFLCVGFTVVLAWVLIYNTIFPVGFPQ